MVSVGLTVILEPVSPPVQFNVPPGQFAVKVAELPKQIAALAGEITGLDGQGCERKRINVGKWSEVVVA